MSDRTGQVDAKATGERILRYYDAISSVYALLASPFERRAIMAGLDLAHIAPGDEVLEVAVGAGGAFVEILRRARSESSVHGVDLSPKMVETTRRRARRAGFPDADVAVADARRLPFPDASFDVLFNSFMLDLVPFADIPEVLAEFKRVLKPGGRMVLVNLSKADQEAHTWWETLYRRAPAGVASYVLGGCRPVIAESFVQDAGFGGTERRLMPGPMFAELVLATKPGPNASLS